MSVTDDTPPRPLRAELRSAPRPAGPDRPRGLERTVSGQPRLPLRAQPEGADGGAQTSPGPQPHSGAVPLRRGDPSGGGGADGGALRDSCGRGDRGGPNFHLDVPPDGYAWWYVDGISDDGSRAVSVIGFIGSVFSPWYAWSGRRDPENHVCLNVATYGPGGRFTMTDRGRAALRTTPDTFRVGPSGMHWTGTDLVIDIDEVSGPPVISRVRGQIRLTPAAITDVELPLTPDGAHIWRPFAPIGAISVDLDAPGWHWTGHGYFDANFGTRALETDFDFWTWGRYPTRDGATVIYDADRRDGSHLARAFRFTPEGGAEVAEAPPRTPFRRSLWQVRRETRADPGTTPRQALNMLDAPFYSRSAVTTRLNGESVTGVHEALDLRRFRSPLLKPMLAVRVPRRRGWRWPD